jgi:segregation and condensation protein B
MEFDRLKSTVEAILFTTGQAESIKDMAKALDVSEEEVKSAAESLRARYEEEGRGIRIIRLEDSYQMCTNPDFYDALIALELAPKKPRLTDVMLETLSVIAYKQPVTKSEVERIRGVNSDHAINRLIEYRLVRELGRAKLPGRPILFGTTEEFLRRFGVSSSDDLPDINPVKLEDFRAEAESEAGVTVDV